MEWLSKHWFILCFVFASGSAAAWQEVQRRTIERVVIEQHQIVTEQKKYGEALIKLQVQQLGIIQYQRDIRKKIDLLIELQIKRVH
jgi:hypothetical protein